MPHHFIRHTPEGTELLASVQLTLNEFGFEICRIVARVLHDELGENMVVGEDVVVDQIMVSRLLPASVSTIGEFYATAARLSHKILIGDLIRIDLRDLLTSRGMSAEDAKGFGYYPVFVGSLTPATI